MVPRKFKGWEELKSSKIHFNAFFELNQNNQRTQGSQSLKNGADLIHCSTAWTHSQASLPVHSNCACMCPWNRKRATRQYNNLNIPKIWYGCVWKNLKMGYMLYPPNGLKIIRDYFMASTHLKIHLTLLSPRVGWLWPWPYSQVAP